MPNEQIKQKIEQSVYDAAISKIEQLLHEHDHHDQIAGLHISLQISTRNDLPLKISNTSMCVASIDLRDGTTL